MPICASSSRWRPLRSTCDLLRAQLGQILVGVGVVADVVTFGVNALHDFGVAGRIGADDIECRFDILGRQEYRVSSVC